MISRDNFIDTTLQKLEALQIGQCLDIRSYKRNRKVVIEKLADGYTLYEDGFATEVFASLTTDKLEKLLRVIEKREFPRSNKLRFYILDDREGSVSRANYMLREDEGPAEEDPTFLVRINCGYSRYDQLRNIIENGGGIIEKADFAHAVNLVVRLEEPLYQQLSTLFHLIGHIDVL